MQLYRPEVVLTYAPNGFSGHPDHIRTHDLVVAAHRHVIANGEAERIPAPRLYYIALSKSRLRGARDRARAALGADAWVPPDEMAIDDAHITTVIDVAAFWPDKLRAMAAHASQSDAAALLQMFSAADESVERVEEYVRAFPTPAEGPVFIEDDFFNDGR
jgi:LmbE family N-acetylglucosaminyl deacetylase